MVRGLDQAVFAVVASRGDGWVVSGTRPLGGQEAGLFWWGWGLLLGSFRGKHNHYIVLAMTLKQITKNGTVHVLTSANHMWTRPPGSTLRMGGSESEMN